MSELVKYAQRITINDERKEVIIMAASRLIDSAYAQSENRKEIVEFFKMNFTNSEKVLNAKDLILEWAVTPHKP